MKKNIIKISLIIVFIIVSLQINFAQNITIGEHKINNSIYKTKYSSDNLRLLIDLKDKPDIPENKEMIDGLPSTIVNARPTNSKEWQQLVVSTLSKEKIDRLKQLKEKLSILFFAKPATGEIYYMSYALPRNTIMTIQDLSSLDQKLKSNYKFKFQSHKNKHLQLSWTMISSDLDFSKL